MRLRSAIWIGTLLSLLIFTVHTPAQAARKLRFTSLKKKAKKIKGHELSVRPGNNRAYTQSWNMWAWNSQGYVVYGLFVVTKIIGGARLGVQLTIRTPKGKVIHKMVEYSKGQYNYKKNRLLVWVPNKHVFRFSGKRGRFIANFGKWGVKFKMKKTLPGFRFTNGPIRFGSKRFIGLTFAPRLSVKGTIRINNKKIKFKGVGYSDHGWQNIMPHHVSRRWYAGRMISKDYTIIASQLLPATKWRPRSVPGLSIAKGNKWIFHGDHRHVKLSARRRIKDKDSGYMVPQYVVYRGKRNGTKVKLVIKHKKLFDKMDVMSQFNPVLRVLLRALIANPWIFRYQAEFTLTIKKGGKTTKIRRLGFSEWALLNK